MAQVGVLEVRQQAQERREQALGHPCSMCGGMITGSQWCTRQNRGDLLSDGDQAPHGLLQKPGLSGLSFLLKRKINLSAMGRIQSFPQRQAVLA